VKTRTPSIAMTLFGMALLATLPPSHAADLSFTPAFASDYDFRGISNSALKPAFQPSLDLSTDSGFRANLWASNVEFGVPDVDVEVDYSLAWSGDAAGLNLDTGVAIYTYPGASDLNYPEAWAGLAKKFGDTLTVDGKLWYSWDYAGTDRSATYVETNATLGLPLGGLELSLHAGYSSGDYWDDVNGQGYLDYAVGVGRTFGRLDVALKFIDGSDLPDLAGTDVYSTDRKLVLSIATQFPRR
jgi:uncharacterized protein (TIGR02001 family)